MIVLSAVSTGTYGPFFLDGGTLVFAASGTAGTGGNGVSGTLTDESGVTLQNFGISAGGTGAFKGSVTREAPSGNWTFVVDPTISGLGLTVRRIPQ